MNDNIFNPTNRIKDLIVRSIAKKMGNENPYSKAKIYMQYLDPDPNHTNKKWIGFYVTEDQWDVFKSRTGTNMSFREACELIEKHKGKENSAGLPVTGIDNRGGRYLYIKFSNTSPVK